MDQPDLENLLHSVAGQCIAVRVRVLNRVVTATYDAALRTFGLRVSQMNILVASAAFGPVRPADLCALLHLDPSTLSRNVERLKKKGLVETVPEEGSRTHRIRVLPRGVKALQDAYPAWVEAQQKSATLLGDNGVKALMEMGNRLLGGVLLGKDQ